MEKRNEIKNRLLASVRELNIVDYHCHLSPEEIFLDAPFSNLGELLLAHDHYKWRLMRTMGVDEAYITGEETTIREKYDKLAYVCARAFGNPIKEWVRLELKTYFGIDTPLNEHTADEIWERAQQVIQEKMLSPQKILNMSKVEYVATTDDLLDSLEFHEKLTQCAVKVAPTFRTDKLMHFNDLQYITDLSELTEIEIKGIDSLEKAVEKRLQFFIERGCKFSDVGIEGFPKKVAPREEADVLLKEFLKEGIISNYAIEKLQGYLFVFLGKLYARYNIVMQLHLAVMRNPNTKAHRGVGKDAGFDSVGDTVKILAISNILNHINEYRLPKTIIYTLNPAMYYPLITLCGSFKEVIPGIAWWFCDHKRGIFEFLEKVSELGHINGLIGMLTDSRSFLSYVRHDYFREILCDFLSSFYEEGNYEFLEEVAKNLSYYNAKALIDKKSNIDE